MSRLRVLLFLGRVSNLPTVWSNCLAGWWLGGGENPQKLLWLFPGATLLYLGGMFLNDAFDASFDQQHRRERPIPSGAITRAEVWRMGFLWLALGIGCFLATGWLTTVVGLALACCILIYNALHKLVAFSPVLMGLCRFVLYVLAASTGTQGITGNALWCGLVMGCYVAGLSGLARKESLPGRAPRWPLLPLAAPLVLALLLNAGGYRDSALLLSLVVLFWIVRCLRRAYRTQSTNFSRTVSGLLAGIVLVDWLAVAPELSRTSGIWFLLLFLGTLLCQRFIPAT